MNRYVSPRSIKREILQDMDMVLYAGRILIGKLVEFTQSKTGRNIAKVGLAGAIITGAGYAFSEVGGPSSSKQDILKDHVEIVKVQPDEGWDGIIETANPNISAQNLYTVSQIEQQRYGDPQPGENVLVPVISGQGGNTQGNSVAPVKHLK